MAKTGPKPKDFTGLTFGRWTVIGPSQHRGRHILWRCRCECGVERFVLRFVLTAGQSRSCGECQVEDLSDRAFGKWVVLRFDPVKSVRMRYWICRCECGTERSVVGSSLKNGASRGCGCEKAAYHKARLTQHGMAGSKPHMVWEQMRQRCGNPNHKAFHSYGGRNIKVCERWQDFVLFWADMGPTYEEGMSIERVNNDGDYEPGNCVWILSSIQSKNRRPSSEWRRNNEASVTPRGVLR